MVKIVMHLCIVSWCHNTTIFYQLTQDLAGRNILVSDNETCKVADFGLLREIPKDDSIYQMHTNVPCPVRWMPPESISQRKFSTASDVWSFGVLQWEMFNPKKMPYGSFGNMEVAMKVSSVHVHRMCVLSRNNGLILYLVVDCTCIILLCTPK